MWAGSPNLKNEVNNLRLVLHRGVARRTAFGSGSVTEQTCSHEPVAHSEAIRDRLPSGASPKTTWQQQKRSPIASLGKFHIAGKVGHGDRQASWASRLGRNCPKATAGPIASPKPTQSWVGAGVASAPATNAVSLLSAKFTLPAPIDGCANSSLDQNRLASLVVLSKDAGEAC
jgi:hypothetical protein